MSKCMKDPREDVLRAYYGVGYYLEEGKREENENGENWRKWGSKVLDLCDLPVNEYMKPLAVKKKGGGGGGGSGSGSTITKYTLRYYINNILSKTYTNLEEGDLLPEYSAEREGYDVTEWKDRNGVSYETMPAKNLKLYCTRTIKTFTVRYIIDGEVVSSYVANYNTAPRNIPSTIKDGYTFSGWEPNTATTRITENTDFVGSFTINSYTVTWKINGETTTEEYNYGETIIYPIVNVEGYTFVSWNGYQETMPSRNITITAVLKINSYVLTYNIESDSGTRLYSSASVVYNKVINQKPIPSKNGYSYTQWESDGVYSTMPSHDVTYTTQETKNIYTLHYLVDGIEVKSIDYEYLAIVVKQPRYEKEGYDVTNWVGEPNTMPYNNVSATCTTTIKTFVVTIKDDNGNVIGRKIVDYGTTVDDIMSEYPGYSYNGQISVITSTTELYLMPNNYDVIVTIGGDTYIVSLPYKSNIKQGVTDYLENNLTEEELKGHHIAVNVGDKATVSVGGNSVTAELIPNEYTVIINGYNDVKIAYGDTILDKLPDVETAEGEEFIGWFNGDEQITEESVMPDEDITLVPRTIIIEKPVVVVVDGIIGETVYYEYGTPICDIISNVDLGEKGEDEGYTAEWTVNGVSYNSGMTVGYDDVLIVCEFVVNNYVLSFFNENVLISSALTPYKSTIGQYPEMPEREGYRFIWDGEILTGTEMPSHNVNVVGSYVAYLHSNNFYYGFKMNSEISDGNIESGLTLKSISEHNSELPLFISVKSVSEYGEEIENEWEQYYGEDEEYTENWNTNYAYSIIFLIPVGKTIDSCKQGSTGAPEWAGNSLFETNYGSVVIDECLYNIFGYRNTRTGYVVTDTNAPKQFYVRII